MRSSVDHPYAVLRPYMWIAGASFATGFLGYLSYHGMLF